MSDQSNIDTSSNVDADSLDPGWAWERLVVVDTGNGEIGLHSAAHNRFVRLNGFDEQTVSNLNADASDVANVDALPPSSTWERFVVVHLGNGEIALHCTILNRFLAVDVQNTAPGQYDVLNVGSSAPKAVTATPTVYEKFTVVAA